MPSLRRDLLLIAAVLAVAVGFAVALFASGGSAPFSHHGSYRVKLLVPSAMSLGPGAEVRIAGVQVGRLDAIERRGRGAELEVELEDDTAPIPADSQFALRLRSLIGENYLEIYPGRSRTALPAGGVLPLSAQKFEYVELEQVLDLLKGNTRKRARQLLRGTGDALDGHGRDLNRVIGGASRVITDVAPVLQVLRQDRARLARLVEQVGDVSRAVGERGAAIETLARQGRRTAETLASGDDALRATLDALPPALRQVRTTSGTLRGVTRGAAPMLTQLAAVLDDLRPSVRGLGPAAAQARLLLDGLQRTTTPLRQTLRSLRRASGPLTSALPAVKDLTCQLNPMVLRLEPYRDDAGALLQNLASVTSYYDANGHAGRLLAMAGQYSIAPQADSGNTALQTLVDAGVLGKEPGVGYNPFPKAGEGARPAAGRGLGGIQEHKTPYERVHAAC